MHDYRGTAFASELLISVNKVNIFWGGQKIRRNLPVDLNDKSAGRYRHIFVAFSEYMSKTNL